MEDDFDCRRSRACSWWQTQRHCVSILCLTNPAVSDILDTSVCSGKTTGDMPMTFGRKERAQYKTHIVPIFGRFLQSCYSELYPYYLLYKNSKICSIAPEECRSRALSQEEGFETLESLLAAESGHAETEYDTIEFSQALGNQSSSAEDGSPEEAQPLTTQNDEDIASSQRQPSPPPHDAIIQPQPPPPSDDEDIASSQRQPSPLPHDAIIQPQPPPPSDSPINPRGSPVPSHIQSPCPSPLPSPLQSRAQTPVIPQTPRLSVYDANVEPSPMPSLSGLLRLSQALGSPESRNSPALIPPRVVSSSPECVVSSDSTVPASSMPEETTAANATTPQVVNVSRTPMSANPSSTPTAAITTMSATPTTPIIAATSVGDPSRKRPIADDDASPPSKRICSEHRSVSPVPPVTPDTTSPQWFKTALVMLQKKDLGHEWARLVHSWAAFEVSAGHNDTDLGKANRPKLIGDWIQRKRSPTWRPPIENVDAYGEQFTKWWFGLQPEWRRSEDGKVLVESVAGDWSAMKRSGKNGLLSVLAALFYWGLNAEDKTDIRKKWCLAVADCQTVISHF
jgi:hypothetical protein